MAAWLRILVLGLLLLVSAPMALANSLTNLRAWPAPDETRVVADLSGKAEFSYFTLTKPDRLVIDLKDTKATMPLPFKVEKSDIVSRVRKSSPPAKGTYRLVFELKGPTKPNIFALAPMGEFGNRLVIDLPHPQKKASANPPASIARKPDPAASEDSVVMPFGTSDIIVAIDAGHGGSDPGAIGPSRKYEKYVTLAIAKKVAADINAKPGMKAVLTRGGDYFIDLNKRSQIARRHKAHLLVSIHADGFTQPQPRGASVWVLSRRRANSEIGRWIEKHEEQSNLLGGGSVLANNEEDENLSRTVLDLQFLNSQREGYEVAVRVLKELGKVTRLHKSKPEHASLAVLKSPDIPSLLVETGFISNPGEERLLFNRNHQRKLADAIVKGIYGYFSLYPPDGTLMAARKNGIKHKVTSGQSLSVIAKKYGSSIAAIKKANGLKSNSLRIGQVLTIPNVSTKALETVASSSSSKPSSKAGSSPSGSTAMVTHVVKKGEFLGKIADKYKVSVASIRSANALKRDTLWVGQKLKIVGARVPERKHKVSRGEFLGKIAQNYGVTVTSIRNANNLRSDTLRVGQVLIIPGS